MDLLRFLLLSLLALPALAVLSRATNILWPRPISFSYDTEGPSLPVNPCNMKFTINAADEFQIQQILDLYQTKVFGCSSVQQTKG